MKLFIKLTGVAVGAILLIVFVALLSSIQGTSFRQETPTKIEPAKNGTTTLSTTTPPAKSTKRTVVSLPTANPSAGASSSISTPILSSAVDG